jgi:thiamine biosynthesis lipoprotein
MIRRIEFRAMGCQVLAASDISSGRSARLLEEVPGWFENWEAALSRFRPESELSQLNNQPGTWVPVSKTLWNVLQAACRAEKESGGLVTPVLLDAVVAAGYTTSFDQLANGGLPLPSLETKVPVHSIREIVFETEQRSVHLPTGLHLDLGGVAKGWAAHQAMRRLAEGGAALVDAGGDVAVSGLQASGQPWLVGIDDPRHEVESLCTLRLGRCGIATSGRDRRRWQQDGRWKHHIIDPRTGEPAETDVLTATIVAPTVIEAEMAAKVVLIQGSREGLSWLERRSGYAGLVVTEAGAVIASSAFNKLVRGENGYRADQQN